MRKWRQGAALILLVALGWLVLMVMGSGQQAQARSWWWPFGAQEEEIEIPPPQLRAFLDSFRVNLRLTPKAKRITRAGDDYALHDVEFFSLSVNGEPLAVGRARLIELKAARLAQGLARFRAIMAHDVTFSGKTRKGRTFRISIPKVDVGALSILMQGAGKTPQEKFIEMMPIAEAGEIPRIIFHLEDGEPLELRGLRWKWAGDRRTGAGKGELNLGEMQVPLAALMERDNRPAGDVRRIRELGLEVLTLTGKSQQQAAWLEEGALSLSWSVELGAKEAGFVQFGLTDMRLPRALLEQSKKLDSMLQKRSGSANPGQMPSAEELRMLAQLGGLSVKGARLGWRDAGLTRRVLALQAREQGLSVEEYIERQIITLRARLSSLGVPQDKLDRLVLAMEVFLKDPRDILIELQGATPLSISDVLTALIMPSLLFGKLNLRVVVNGKEMR